MDWRPAVAWVDIAGMRTDSAPDEEEEAHLGQRTELTAEVAEVIDQLECAVALAEVRGGFVVDLVG